MRDSSRDRSGPRPPRRAAGRAGRDERFQPGAPDARDELIDGVDEAGAADDADGIEELDPDDADGAPPAVAAVRGSWMPKAALALAALVAVLGALAGNGAQQREAADVARRTQALADEVAQLSGPYNIALFLSGSQASGTALPVHGPTILYAACAAPGAAIALGPYSAPCDGRVAVYGPFDAPGDRLVVRSPAGPWAIGLVPVVQDVVTATADPGPDPGDTVAERRQEGSSG